MRLQELHHSHIREASPNESSPALHSNAAAVVLPFVYSAADLNWVT